MELKDCFREDFSTWLSKSNHPKIKPYIKYQSKGGSLRYFTLGNITFTLNKVVEESLTEILDILLREPVADYFWYGYPEHGGKLSYSLPHHDLVPSDALRVDKEKIKIFLRDYKLETILQ